MSLSTQRIRSTAVTTNVTLTTTTETVIATLAGVATPSRDAIVRLKGWLQLTLGTLTTDVTLRIRRGTAITDTLVGEANAIAVPSAAGTIAEFNIAVQDTPGEVAGQSYVLTAEQTGATGNGTALQASIEASMP